MMARYEVESYTRQNGRQPFTQWLESIEVSGRSIIRAKTLLLAEHGLVLLNTSMLKPIRGYGNDFYEIVTRPYRIATYYDRKRDAFVLLWGWRKSTQRRTADIEQAARLMSEYIARHGGD
jgi:hypothetical protein